ncbi:hypothetical protein E2562_010297 [Oryza meyeriana var. granulata]|uniref:Uncharacterized protein n=1 Tax=Oryza meyeriana var. granulata TaxID=110450 RepID=A0A6G1F646_9ORYZ|nr:hypothetical protein E2562_010297 [Oryza meyeriana var. granulata]
MQDSVLAGPCPELAGRVRRICEREDWYGVLCHLWPEARYISCVTTGTIEQYFPAIKHFASETVPVLGTDYLAFECPIGINLERMSPPEETTYMLLPTVAYFEFIPFNTHAGRRGRAGGYRWRGGRQDFVIRAPPPQENSDMVTERDVMAAMDTFQLMLKDGKESLPAGGEVIEFVAFISDDGGGWRRRAKIAIEEARSSIFEQIIDVGANTGAGQQEHQKPPQTELLTKTQAQSRTSVVYKFATDYML